MSLPCAPEANPAPAAPPRRERPSRVMVARTGMTGAGMLRASVTAMLVGPVLIMGTPGIILLLALGELGNILAGQRQGVAVGELAAAALVLLPAAWLTGFPLARLWLRWPWGGYAGALLQGALLGLFWTAIGTQGALMWRVERLGLTSLMPLSLADILTNAALVGIPLGLSTAAVFWIDLERRSGGSRRRMGMRIVVLLVLAWMQAALVAAASVFLD